VRRKRTTPPSKDTPPRWRGGPAIAAEVLRQEGVYDPRKVIGVTALDVAAGSGREWDPVVARTKGGAGLLHPCLDHYDAIFYTITLTTSNSLDPGGGSRLEFFPLGGGQWATAVQERPRGPTRGWRRLWRSAPGPSTSPSSGATPVCAHRSRSKETISTSPSLKNGLNLLLNHSKTPNFNIWSNCDPLIPTVYLCIDDCTCAFTWSLCQLLCRCCHFNVETPPAPITFLLTGLRSGVPPSKAFHGDVVVMPMSSLRTHFCVALLLSAAR